MTRTRASALLLATALAGAAPACIVTSPEPSHVARGQRFAAGDPLYDEFFTNVHELQVKLGTVADEELAIRTRLAQELSLPASEADVDALVRVVESRAGEFARRGTKLRVEIRGEPGDEDTRAELVVVGDEKPASAFRTALDRALDAELAFLAQVTLAREELERLESMARGLDRNAARAFRRAGLTRRAEVKKNLNDAQSMIPLMSSRALEAQQNAERLVRRLALAATTAEDAPPPKAPEAAPTEAPVKPPPKWSKKPASGGAKPSAAPAPKPAAKPAPKPASDFEP